MTFTLEEARRLRKISRKKAAEEANVSESTLYRWETGQTAPDSEQFRTLCRLYDMSMDDVFVCKSN